MTTTQSPVAATTRRPPARMTATRKNGKKSEVLTSTKSVAQPKVSKLTKILTPKVQMALIEQPPAPEATPTVYSGPMLALRERSKAGHYQIAPNGQPSCGDEIAQQLGTLRPEFVIRACIIAMALPFNPYGHLNVGQQSMNLRNRLRTAIKRGDFGMGVIIEAVEEAQAEQDAATH